MLHHVAGREKKQVEFQLSFFRKLSLKILPNLPVEFQISFF